MHAPGTGGWLQGRWNCNDSSMKLKLQYCGHRTWRTDSFKKTLMLGKIESRRRWRQRMTEDEMVGWHHQLNGHEFEQAQGVGDGQGCLVCSSPWGCRDGHDWVTELSLIYKQIIKPLIKHFFIPIIWCMFRQKADDIFSVFTSVSVQLYSVEGISLTCRKETKEIVWVRLQYNLRITNQISRRHIAMKLN